MVPLAVPETTYWVPPLYTTVPLAIAAADLLDAAGADRRAHGMTPPTTAVPPLETMSPLAVPPENTASTPPLLTTALMPVPPLLMPSLPPQLSTVALAVPPESTICCAPETVAPLARPNTSWKPPLTGRRCRCRRH